MKHGKVVPVTVIEAGPCTVTGKMTKEKEGYEAVQLGYEDVAEKKLTKPEKGHLDKAGVGYKKHLKEFRLEDCASVNVGDVVKADTFKEGDKVDITGISKGHGYAGVIKRFGAGPYPDQPRRRPCAPSRRLHGLEHRSFPYLPGQEAGRPHGRGSGHRPEPRRGQGRPRAQHDRCARRRSPARRAAWSSSRAPLRTTVVKQGDAGISTNPQKASGRNPQKASARK